MRKIGIMAALVAGLWATATAQVREDKISLLDGERLCLRMDMDYDAKLLSTALADKLKQAGVKAKTSKDLTVATGAKLIEISPDLMDYYFKVGAIDKKRSVLYLGISKGYTNFIDSSVNPQAWENGKHFLLNMVSFASRYQMQADAKEMEKTVKTAQKGYDKSVKDFKKQEEALDQSRKNMEAAQTELNNKKAELEALQLKIKR